ncbi:MAG TPA: hypothetical protein DCE41_15760 [Cytophagales bacterium]|nr:hypothetical protein [Cytophagales bacterium]HAA23383.1 hypothetical protein [Cytophagales bacterium]HAP58137.1 hypothetical protein [Cytophagales bacterium]
MRSKIFGLWALLGAGILTPLKGQILQSPYTSYGIGELQSTATTGNLGMGGIGIGGGHPLLLNTRNSAWLARNLYTAFDIGLQGEYRTLTTDSSFNDLATGGLRNMAFGFPIYNKKNFGWTTSLGLSPYSTVSYQLVGSEETVGPLGEVARISEGSGGYNTVYWANGVRLGKNLYLGAKINYLFGTVVEEAIVTFEPFDVIGSSNIALYERYSVGDFLWEASAGYQFKLSDLLSMRVGGYYGGGANVNTEGLNTLQIRSLQFGTPTTSDTLFNAEGTQHIPFSAGAGIAFEQASNWIIGVDFDYQPWSQYRDVQGNPGSNLTDQWRVSLGSQITPEWNSANYLRRVGYGMGVHYENTPVVESGRQITDFGINFGLSLPVSRTGSTLNTVVQVGRRGTTLDNLIQENYVKLNLGMTFNQLWFIRSKYD